MKSFSIMNKNRLDRAFAFTVSTGIVPSIKGAVGVYAIVAGLAYISEYYRTASGIENRGV